MNEILIRKAKKGDKDAFCRLMDEQMQSMYKLAISYVKNDEDAADAIQDTILSCYENLKSLKYNRYFKTWMIRILINQCNGMIRQGRREVAYGEIPDIMGEQSEYALAEFKDLLERLDEKYRLILILYYVEEFKIAEIAKLLDLHENTVKTRLRRGRNSLKQEYEKMNLKEAGI